MNKNTLINFFMFAAGAAIGSVATWKLVDEKYKRIADKEIAEMREYFSNKAKPAEDVVEEEPKVDPTQTDIFEYANILNEQGYTNYREVTTDDISVAEKPYVITPEEFGENEGYQTVSLYYYSDGVLADDCDDLIEDVDDVVGLDSLNHFGEYEDDSVFVRNDRRKIDYEILLDPGTYSDLINQDLHSAEDE